MQGVEQLQTLKQRCNDMYYNLKGIKKVDKDIIDQMNQNVSQLGCSINNYLLNDEKEGHNQDLVSQVINIYEKTTQYLDNIIYKHKAIYQHVQNLQRSSIKAIDETIGEHVDLQKDISEFTLFKHLEKLNILEDNNIEFKNYTIDSFNQRTTRITIKKTIVSFLNRYGGCIYLGIRDDTTVVGMKISLPEMDQLKRKIITIKQGIVPSMNDKVKIDFIPIKQGSRWYKGHWVVRIRVQQGDLTILYQFDNKQDPYSLESYFREDGAVIRYKVNDYIQEKISIETNNNPKRRSVIRKEYSLADPEGLKACMSQQQNNQQQFNNSNQQQFGNGNEKQYGNINQQYQNYNRQGMVYQQQYQYYNGYKPQYQDIQQQKQQFGDNYKQINDNPFYRNNKEQDSLRHNMQQKRLEYQNPFDNININQDELQLDQRQNKKEVKNDQDDKNKIARQYREQFRENKANLNLKSQPYEVIQDNNISLQAEVEEKQSNQKQQNNQLFALTEKMNSLRKNKSESKLQIPNKLDEQDINENNRIINEDANTNINKNEDIKVNTISNDNNNSKSNPQNTNPILSNSIPSNQQPKQQKQRKRFGALFYETLYGPSND